MAPSSSPFDRLHPAVQHHVVNSLGWRALRPLQIATIEPILAGEHLIATAPTAGGKTEAAVLPLFSRMLTEEWRGLSVLYVCPLRALLNNLHPRLERYGHLVGRTVGLWHGDIGQPERKRLLAEPPDLLLTTPESLESMLVSRGVAHEQWFANVRAVVVDEAHAFAADDRGWHLLSVLERITRLAGREVQRIALSATVGNPKELVAWLTATCRRPARVVNPPAEVAVAEVTLDYVGSLANAALVISRLHRGEKRLVFVDSRARAEQLALALRGHDVTTFVSHGSLGAGERRAAEQAFTEERDCVIVATSTLELGIDVGDLDRMIQIDAPPTVAAFLQRLGRTGRRSDTVRQALLLATSDDALLRAAAVLVRWAEGYVEPIIPPSSPFHLVAQQLLALSLQESGVGRQLWMEWMGDPFVLGTDAAAAVPAVVDHLMGAGFLVDDGNGMLGIGLEAEASLGRQHFMELLSVFTSPPVFSVRHGRVEIGLVPDETLMARPAGLAAGGAAVLVLGGRSWAIQHVDWTRRVVQVEPTDAPGVARWSGSAQPLGAAVARAVREVLLGADPAGVVLSQRAGERLVELRAEHPWVRPGATSLVVDERGRARWWTFAGWRANLWLARAASDLRLDVAAVDDLTVALDPTATIEALRAAVDGVVAHEIDLAPWVPAEVVDGLKFSECLPRSMAVQVVTRRLADHESATLALSERLVGWRVHQ